ncbi:MAG: hypothetical protein RR290_01085 [Clostridia bacterium]
MIITLGKELTDGYCQNFSKINKEEYLNSLKKIEEKIPKNLKLYTISMTKPNILEVVDYDYMPGIIEYTEETQTFFDPVKIFNRSLMGKDNILPNVDFIIFDEKDEIAVVAFSKTAPIIVFECKETGKKAIGVILKKALIKNGMYVIDTIVKYLGGKVTITIPLCTHYKYKDIGTIPDFIKEICFENEDICEIKIGIDSSINTNFYNQYDTQNNVVILY